MQHLPDNEKTGSTEEISCLKWTLNKDTKKTCTNFNTDTDKSKIIVHRYRSKLFLKTNENDMKATEYQTLLARQVYP